MIRALIFDLGNVLVHFSHERMCRQIGELAGRPAADVRDMLMGSGLFERYESGNITSASLHAELQHLFQRTFAFEALCRAASDIFWPNETMEPVIERLSKKGLPLVLLSNTCEPHIRWVAERFGVLRHFGRRVLSFEVGAAKPNRAIFEAAAHVAGAAPQECFFTDDTAGHIAAARELGFDAMVYQNTPELVRALEARGLW